MQTTLSPTDGNYVDENPINDAIALAAYTQLYTNLLFKNTVRLLDR
jgi:hypothetical protein